MSTARKIDAFPAAAAERHPAGLYVLFATEMWERFSFYTVLEPCPASNNRLLTVNEYQPRA